MLSSMEKNHKDELLSESVHVKVTQSTKAAIAAEIARHKESFPFVKFGEGDVVRQALRDADFV